MSSPEDAISAWLTNSGFGFTTFVTRTTDSNGEEKPLRFWRLAFGDGPADAITVILQVGGIMFTAAVQLQLKDVDEAFVGHMVRNVNDETPFVKIVSHRTDEGEPVLGACWVRTECIIDPNPPHISPLAIEQAIGLTVTTVRSLLVANPEHVTAKPSVGLLVAGTDPIGDRRSGPPSKNAKSG